MNVLLDADHADERNGIVAFSGEPVHGEARQANLQRCSRATAFHRLIEIDIASRLADRLILAFFQGCLEFAIQHLRLNFEIFSALFEDGFAPGSLLFQEGGSMIQIKSAALWRRRVVANDFSKLGINAQMCSATGALN
jgi:hypothetical protein